MTTAVLVLCALLAVPACATPPPATTAASSAATPPPAATAAGEAGTTPSGAGSIGSAKRDGPTVAPTGSSEAPAPAGRAGGRWVPAPGTTWQWQLTTPVDVTVDAEVFSIDGFNNDAGVVRELHRRGRKVICYVEVGAAEDFRPDYHRWPADLLGKSNGWPGERWLDIRRPHLLEPVLASRFDMCRKKGFDGVEPDLMDAHVNDTGFPITAPHQLAFNRFVARLAHERGLSVGLKNDAEHAAVLVDHFEFSINEECYAHRECAALRPFIAANKAVFHAEYEHSPGEFCPHTRRLGLSSIRKNWDLDAARWTC